MALKRMGQGQTLIGQILVELGLVNQSRHDPVLNHSNSTTSEFHGRTFTRCVMKNLNKGFYKFSNYRKYYVV